MTDCREFLVAESARHAITSFAVVLFALYDLLLYALSIVWMHDYVTRGAPLPLVRFESFDGDVKNPYDYRPSPHDHCIVVPKSRQCPAFRRLGPNAYEQISCTSVFDKSPKIQSQANLRTSPVGPLASKRTVKILTITNFGKRLSGLQQTSGRTTHFV